MYACLHSCDNHFQFTLFGVSKSPKKKKTPFSRKHKKKTVFFSTTLQFQRVQQKDLMSCDHCCRRVDNLTLDNKRDTELDATDGIIVWRLHVLTSDCIKQLP